MSSEVPGGTHPRADVLAEEYRGRYLWDELDNAKARIAALEEQHQTALDRLWEAHDQLCGCDRPTDAGRCSAPQETWGAFEYLGERPASNPSSGALSTAGSMSAPEASSPASVPARRTHERRYDNGLIERYRDASIQEKGDGE